MILVVGLGNPGKKYQKTRHNIGFRVLDKFSKKNRDVHYFSNFKFEKKFQALISEGKFNNEKIILAKPQTFMNNSGKSVKLLTKTCNLKPETLFVIHDDIDLLLGKIKISIGRGAAGHKGVESIIKEIGTKNFARFRIGIRPENSEQRTVDNVEDFVLQKFNRKEEKIIKEIIKKTVEAIEFSLREGIEKAMSRYNL